MKSATGSYVGNGTSGNAITVGFQPDLVMVNGTVFTTSAHSAGQSSYFANNNPNASNLITALTTTGFTVGTSTTTNQNGTTYYYFAAQITSAADFAVGSYTGTGVTKSITGLGFTPNVVAVKGHSSHYGWWKPSSLSGSNSLGFAGFQNQGNRITSLDTDGFTVGTDVEANENGTSFYWFAFGNNPGAYSAGTYTGNATDNRDITVGFQPQMVWVKMNNPISSVYRFSSHSGDASAIFASSSLSSNMIQAFSSTTFQLGTNAGVNENNTPGFYFAIAAGFTTYTQTFTAKASIVNPTVSFTAQAAVKNIVPKTFTVRAWVRKNVAGALAKLPYRGVDVMKWTKDTTKSQPADATIENIVRFLQENMSLTHIAVVLPIDPLSWYPTSPAYVPSPRTIVACYQKWADEIHNRGLRILHRPVSFGMEGRENFTWRVGGNRYPQGRKEEVIPSLGTFTDDFNRAQIPTQIIQGSSSFEDDFNRSTIGTTDWGTPFGNWSIQNNELICTNVANATSNILLTKATYTDFTATAKVKKVSSGGFSGVAFRMIRDTNNGGRAFANYFSGYLLELRDSNKLRIENIATANLIEVTKTFVTGTYYQVKIQCTGSNIKAKVWENGTSEPGSWDIDFNDTTYSSGSVGFCPENTNATAVFDDLIITFNPTTNIVTDWNTIGNWDILSNQLRCNTSGPQYNSVIYSKATYSNFVYTAKVKSLPSGNTEKTGVIFRGSKITFGFGFQAYTVRIRGNSTLELEDMSLANLQTVSKSFLADTWYNFKIDCSGNVIKARVWKDGDAEPSTWDIDYTDTRNGGNAKYLSGSIGFAPENVQPTLFDDVSVTVAQNLNTWLGVTYNFIVDNPTLFSNGDIWAPYPERTEGIFSDSTSFISYSSPGVQQNYANFFSDLKEVCDYAFSQIGKTGVLTGWTAENYSEVRSGWLPQSLYDKVGVVSFDYYQNYDGSNDFRGAKAKADIDAVYAARGNKSVIWQEWGPVPDMIDKISIASGQTINGYGSIKSPDTNFAQNRETFIRDLYTNALAAAFNENKLIMFNYWGFWDTGENDTGLAKISGSTTDYNSFKFRREGWILEQYFAGGASPQKEFTAKARVSHSSTQTFTAKAKVIHAKLVTFTAQAKISNPLPTDKTTWTRTTRVKTQWTRQLD